MHDDLSLFDRRLAAIRADIDRLNAEREEVENARKVYLRLQNGPAASPAAENATPANSEPYLTFVDVARRILSQSEGPMSPRDICERAAQLGFKGGRTGNVTPEAFRRRLSESKLFQRKDGRFSLKPTTSVNVSLSHVNGRTGRKGLAAMAHIEAAFQVLRQTKRPLKTIEIVRRLQEAGMEGEPKQMRKSLFNAMSRAPAAFNRIGPGLWELTPAAMEAESAAAIDL